MSQLPPLLAVFLLPFAARIRNCFPLSFPLFGTKNPSAAPANNFACDGHFYYCLRFWSSRQFCCNPDCCRGEWERTPLSVLVIVSMMAWLSLNSSASLLPVELEGDDEQVMHTGSRNLHNLLQQHFLLLGPGRLFRHCWMNFFAGQSML